MEDPKAKNVFIDRNKEIKLQNLTNALIGFYISSEQWIRWQAARILIRWNALVIKGEDDNHPSTIKIKQKLKSIRSSDSKLS